MNSDDVRRDFERWANREGFNTEKCPPDDAAFPGQYIAVATNYLWSAWQAAAARYGADCDRLRSKVAELEQELARLLDVLAPPRIDSRPPMVTLTMWPCECSAWNDLDAAKCHSCGKSKESLPQPPQETSDAP